MGFQWYTINYFMGFQLYTINLLEDSDYGFSGRRRFFFAPALPAWAKILIMDFSGLRRFFSPRVCWLEKILIVDFSGRWRFFSPREAPHPRTSEQNLGISLRIQFFRSCSLGIQLYFTFFIRISVVPLFFFGIQLYRTSCIRISVVPHNFH